MRILLKRTKNKLTLVVFLIISLLPHLSAQERELRTVVDSREIDISMFPISTIPGEGLCMGMGSKIFRLDDDIDGSFDFIALKDSSLVMEDFIVTGKNIVVKSDKSVIWTDGETFDGITFEDSDFKIQYSTDSTVFVVRTETPEIFEFKFSDKMPLFHLPYSEKIVDVIRLGDDLMVVSKNNICYFSGGRWILLHSHPVDIITSTFTPSGLFFGTFEALWRLRGEDEIEQFAEGTVKNLLSDGDLLYIVDGGNNVYAVDSSMLLTDDLTQ